MTNHQDKELSGDLDLIEACADRITEIAYSLAAPNSATPRLAMLANSLKAEVARRKSASPQLPVAGQPAGQVVSDDRLLDIARTTGLRATMHGVNAHDVRIILRAYVDALAAAPHSPVAQMSGDATIRPTYYVRHPDGSFSVADPQPILRRYCAAQPQPVHMQVDMRQMLINIAHHWGRTITPDDESMFAEFITLAASHPSNAEKP